MGGPEGKTTGGGRFRMGHCGIENNMQATDTPRLRGLPVEGRRIKIKEDCLTDANKKSVPSPKLHNHR